MISIRSVIGSILDLLYPPMCVSCGALVQEERAYLCAACWTEAVLARDHPELAEEAQVKIGPDVEGLHAAFVFQKTGPLQALVHALKYQGMDQVGVWLGERLGDVIRPAVGPVDLVVPVPLHPAKERERGYNQALAIAKGLAPRLGARVGARLLRRQRHTPSQTKLSIEERRRNVAEAFVVPPEVAGQLGGTRVVIVDDVITTGATIGSCARAIREAGATHVIAAAVALADHHA